jgi:hypothetical protein
MGGDDAIFGKAQGVAVGHGLARGGGAYIHVIEPGAQRSDKTQLFRRRDMPGRNNRLLGQDEGRVFYPFLRLLRQGRIVPEHLAEARVIRPGEIGAYGTGVEENQFFVVHGQHLIETWWTNKPI